MNLSIRSLLAAVSRFTLFALLILRPCTVNARIHPEQGSRISAIHVMFEFDNVPGASSYELRVFDINMPGKPLVKRSSAHLAMLVTAGLQFGHDYKWQFTAYRNGKVCYTSPFYTFSIIYSVRTDQLYFRQKTAGRLTGRKDLVLIDNAAMAINRRGEVVWFLPLADKDLQSRTIRDLSITPAGTFTHLDIHGAYERQPDSTVTWQAPAEARIAGNKKEDYHHQLTKLNDGSFVVAGFQYRPGNAGGNDAPRFNTIIHYNSDSSVRWYWSELESMDNDTLFNRFRQNAGGGHLNGFAFSMDKRRMFLSFKNLSDVFVLNMASGKIESSIKTGIANKAPLFRQQHGPFLTAGNKLLIYNNNISDDREGDNEKTAHPSVQVYRYDTLRKMFHFEKEFKITSPEYPDGIAGKEGYASETSEKNILVCAGGANYAVEISPSDTKEWECYFHRRADTLSAWTAYSNYRCRQVPSLYPVYLTLQYLYTKDGEYYFRLQNAGSSPAAYELQFFSEQNGSYKKNLSGTILPNSVKTIRLPSMAATEPSLHCRILSPGTGLAPKTCMNLLGEKE